jgi:hypothetical protein
MADIEDFPWRQKGGICGRMEARVKAAIWVSMAVRLADRMGRGAAILRKGDPDGGGVLAVLRAQGGIVVLSQVRDGEGRLAWMRGTGPAPVPEAEADAYVARQVGRDPDLWVVEFDAPDGLPPFDGKIL